MAADLWRRRLPPPWLGNLLVFGLLITMVVAWFLFQTRQAQRGFLEDASEHARLLADAVGLHARGAVLAQNATDAILTAFLGSSARFVDYLDGVEPFREDELSAFAGEAGLVVIRVVREDGAVQGPPEWRPVPEVDCGVLQRLIRLPAVHRVLFGVPRKSAGGCVLVGMDSRHIEALQAAVGLPRALDAVAALPGVVRVALQGEPDPVLAKQDAVGAPAVKIRRLVDGTTVAEARTLVAGAKLVLDMDAGPLLRLRDRLWLEFAGFVLVLSVTGGLGTWLLYRRQQAHDRQLRAFERELSQRREEAGLGRAAAAIAHEIRNPLNTMAMGLQRLQMEVDELDEEYRRLVTVMLEAVRRANGTVTGLLDYARPYRPRREMVALDGLLHEQLSLYEQRIRDMSIALTKRLAPDTTVSGDPDLLRQVLDNLLHNALEAQPAGGRLEIRLARERGGAVLSVANDGLSLAAGDVERLLEPWFTTKTEGTGLGLSISRRIVEAHGGRLTLDVPRTGRLRVRVFLPV